MTENERETYIREIATIILCQLRVDVNEMMAWGCEDFRCFSKTINEVDMPTLSFKIRTPKVPQNGLVQISLNEGADLYVVEAIVVTVEERISLGVKENIYAEDLHDVINSLIEDEESFGIVSF